MMKKQSRNENPARINSTDQEIGFFPLTDDLMFHMVFSKNPAALRNLLSCLLNIPETEIKKIEILNPMQYNEQFDMNLTVLDLKLHLNNEKYILVEMQVRRFDFWTNSTLVYACRQIADQDKGKNFDYGKIQPVIQIAILDHTLFPEHKRFFTTYELRDKEGFRYSDRLQFIVMDLTAMAEATDEEKTQGLVEWAEAFKADDWETVEKNENQGVREAMETMKLIMANPGERQLLEYRHKAEVDRRSWYVDALNAGRKEGEIKGENRMVRLVKTLQNQGRIEELDRVIEDSNYRNNLYKELHID